MAAPSVALVWYLVIAGPQGGMVVLPSTFDTRDQCTNAITEYQKQPTPAGWAVNCVPSASPFTDEGDERPAAAMTPANSRRRCSELATGRSASAATDSSGLVLRVWNTTQ